MKEYIPFRQCGDCTACCQGHLIGKAYDHDFYPGKPCFYLKPRCIVYDDRPTACKNYYCAWVQGLFSEKLKPTMSKVIISVEIDENKKKFLKVVPTTKDVIAREVLDEIEKFVIENQTYYKVVRND